MTYQEEPVPASTSSGLAGLFYLTRIEGLISTVARRVRIEHRLPFFDGLPPNPQFDARLMRCVKVAAGRVDQVEVSALPVPRLLSQRLAAH